MSIAHVLFRGGSLGDHRFLGWSGFSRFLGRGGFLGNYGFLRRGRSFFSRDRFGRRNSGLYGYQFSVLMMTPMLPILLWLLFNKRFVASLWLEAALEGPGEQAKAAPRTVAK